MIPNFGGWISVHSSVWELCSTSFAIRQLWCILKVIEVRLVAPPLARNARVPTTPPTDTASPKPSSSVETLPPVQGVRVGNGSSLPASPPPLCNSHTVFDTGGLHSLRYEVSFFTLTHVQMCGEKCSIGLKRAAAVGTTCSWSNVRPGDERIRLLRSQMWACLYDANSIFPEVASVVYVLHAARRPPSAVLWCRRETPRRQSAGIRMHGFKLR